MRHDQPNHFELWTRNVKPHLPMARTLIREHGFRGAAIASAQLPGASTDGAGRMTATIHATLSRIVDHYVAWQDLLDAPESQEVLAFLKEVFLPVAQMRGARDPERLCQQEAITQLILGMHMVRFERQGQHSYVASPGLAERLKHTELRGLRGQHLQLPYKSVFIETPRGLGFQTFHHLEGWKPLHGVYLVENEEPGGRRWFMLFVGGDQVNGITDNYFSSSLLLADGLDLELILHEVTGRLTRTMPDDDRLAIETSWRQIFAWVLNVIVYATWPEAERNDVMSPTYERLLERLARAPKGHPRRRKVLDEIQEVEPRKRTVLGASVRVLDRAQVAGEPGGAGLPLTKRVLVQGHWRHLEPGPGKPWKVEKRMWIEPHWKGELGALVDTAVMHVVGAGE